MVVCRGVVSLGNFLSSVVAGRSKVALRVSRDFGERYWDLVCLRLVIWPWLRSWVGYVEYILH